MAFSFQARWLLAFAMLIALAITSLPAIAAEDSYEERLKRIKQQLQQQQHAALKLAAAGDGTETPYHQKLGMVTGSPTGTYFRFGKDIKDAVARQGVELLVKDSKGSIDNITRIASPENAAFGIVQSDVLGFLTRSNQARSKRMAEDLRMVFPFYQEEVHLIARKNVRSFDHLNDKVIAVGNKGSGSWLTAMNLFSIAGVKPRKILRLSPEEGLVAVLRNRADAMLFVAGKPVKLFENLEKLSGHNDYAAMLRNVHFLPLNKQEMLAEYSKATIGPEDYSFLQHEVPTIAVTALLVSYNFSDVESDYASARCEDMRSFAKALKHEMDRLQKEAHPKWQEVNLNAEVGIWKRDPCTAQDVSGVQLENDLLQILQENR